MDSYDCIIRGGTVVDGTGAPRRVADVGVRDGLVATIATHVRGSAGEEIDARGRIVAPGNIDPHTHYDAQVHWDPYCTTSGWHGGSTVVVGNCGFGFMPCRAADRERYMLMMENTEQVPLGAMRAALSWDWETFPEWMARMRQLPKGVNLGSYLPLNSLMIYVMGYEAAKTRRATADERRQMKDLLNEALDAGALGFGLSHLNDHNSHKDIDGSPMPTDSMDIDDAYALAEVLRERGQGVIQALVQLPGVNNSHVAEELARISGRPVIHNITAAFDAMPEYYQDILRWLDAMEARGLDIYSQALALRSWTEFNAHHQTSWANVDPFHEFAHVGGPREKAALAADPAYRARARAQYTPESMVAAGGPVEGWTLQRAMGAAPWAAFEGRSVGEIAAELGTAPIDCFFDIVAATACQADFRASDSISWDVAKVAEILRHPRVLPGTSDGGAHVKFYSGGHYPTDMIAWLVRDAGVMTLEAMHYKLSWLPARVLQLYRRGALLEGYAADLYVYDYDAIGYDRSGFETVHDLPDGDWRRVVRPQGIELSMVNGQVIARGGDTTGLTPGRMLGNTGCEMDGRLSGAEPARAA
jgi:N-acyl-D-amino-acid deacylase